MLAAFLLTGLITGVLSTVVLLSPLPSGLGRSHGMWAWSRRLVLAIVLTLVLDVVVVAVESALSTTTRNILWSVVAFTAASLVWLPVTRRWSARGHLCWAGTVFLFVAYLAFMLQWTFETGLPPLSEAGGMVLWALEVFAGLLGCAYLWELCDALGSEQWRRRIERGAPAVAPGGQLPFVSMQVPAYNEPPEMVIETLRSLCNLDYPNYEIIVIDDNTTDENLWRPVEAWCRDHGLKFVHLENWPGYKSGALNYALREMTDPRAELIGVVDSDYQMDAQFLRRCAPLFVEPTVGFIQAPQDYRDWKVSSYFRRLYYSYAYFFAVSQPSRNERDGAIFAGTMGLIRRRALEEVGGWNEWCITEDAELSLRLLRAGWSGLHIDRSYGQGVMPLTFEALKGQRFRWCFGGIQIMRMHWRSMMPWRDKIPNRMSLGQRWAYFSGALQWYGDLLALLFFFFLLGGSVNIAAGGGLLFRKLSGFLVATIPLLVGIGLVRAIALLRRGTGASLKDAFGAFMIWQSTALVTARASVQALFAREAEFLRTPKTTEDSNVWDAIKGNRGETLLFLAGVAGIVAALTNAQGYAGPLTAGLLLWPTLSFGMAPLNSLAAQRANLPPRLRARRRTEFLRGPKALRVTAAFGGFAAATGVAAAALLLLAPGQHPVSPPQLLGPAQGKPAYPSQQHNATTVQQVTQRVSPGATPTTGPSSSASGTPSPSPSNASATPSTKPSVSPSKHSPTPSASAKGTPSPTPTSTPSTTSSASPTSSSTPSGATASPSASG